jgi:hypothetical protein
MRPAPAARRQRSKASAGGKGMAEARRKSRAPTAAKRADVIETLVTASAQALALPIDPAWRTSVKRNLQVILTHAALVEQFSLPDEIEPAPVFRA